jgi:hypothetical protein
MSEDYVVVWWDLVEGKGLARKPEDKDKRSACVFRVPDIVTDGIEDLRPGSMIRARVGRGVEGIRGRLEEVEIYQEPDLDFVESMSHAPGLKRY